MVPLDLDLMEELRKGLWFFMHITIAKLSLKKIYIYIYKNWL